MKAWGGIASLQFALPVLWTAARQHGCTLSDIAKWLSFHPAKFTGLSNKGKIEKGCDADLVIWDSNKNFTISPGIILHRHKTTPYMDRNLYGVVEQTFLSGKSVFHKGKMNLDNGRLILR